jgi:aspartyl protease family protein
MFNLSSNEIGSLISHVLILAFLLSSVFIRTSSEKWTKLKHLAIWLSVIFMGVLLYNNKYLFKNFIPYVSHETSDGKIEIQKSQDGHFYIMLKMNGVNVLFLIDTGATTTSLTAKDAERIGIDVSKLKFNQMVNTANGTSFVASTEVKDVIIGGTKIDSMWVMVSKNMDGQSLLGMNFLNRMKGYEVRQNRMVIYN